MAVIGAVGADLEVKLGQQEAEGAQLDRRVRLDVAGQDRLDDPVRLCERGDGLACARQRPSPLAHRGLEFGERLGKSPGELRPEPLGPLDPVALEGLEGDLLVGPPGHSRELGRRPSHGPLEGEGKGVGADAAAVEQGLVDVPENEPHPSTLVGSHAQAVALRRYGMARPG
jgi:hypothetical protein